METKEQHKRRASIYYLKHREEVLARNKKYYNTPEGRKSRLKSMAKYNKTDSAKTSAKKYRLTDARKMSHTRYKLSLKGRINAKLNIHKRRLRVINAEGIITRKLIQRVYEDNIKKYGTLTCILCNMPICFGDDSLEHRTPLIRGGSNLYENLGISHKKCNACKGTRTMEEWENKKEKSHGRES